MNSLHDSMKYYENRYLDIIKCYDLEKAYSYYKLHNISNYIDSYHGYYHVYILSSNFIDFINSKEIELEFSEIRNVFLAILFHDFNYISSSIKDLDNIDNAINSIIDYYSYDKSFDLNLLLSLIKCTEFPLQPVSNSFYSEYFFHLIRDLDHSMFISSFSNPEIYPYLVSLLYHNEMKSKISITGDNSLKYIFAKYLENLEFNFSFFKKNFIEFKDDIHNFYRKLSYYYFHDYKN